MALGLEQALAEYIAGELGVGLYDDADAANRIVFVQQQPPVYTPAIPPADGETAAPLTITVFYDGGIAPQLRIQRTHTMTVQVRHPSYETAMAKQFEIEALLQENGGQSNGAAPHAQGLFRGIRVARITANFPPVAIGRDENERDGRFATSQSFTVRTKPFMPS